MVDSAASMSKTEDLSKSRGGHRPRQSGVFLCARRLLAQNSNGRGRDRIYKTRKGKSGRSFHEAQSAPGRPHLGGLSLKLVEVQMSDIAQGASALTEFHSINAAGECLFWVKPGLPVREYLDHAGCYLQCAEELAYLSEDLKENPSLPHTVAYLVQIGYALVDAATRRLVEEGRYHE
jgi:hypothetical protein